jgi:hypothetical protein
MHRQVTRLAAVAAVIVLAPPAAGETLRDLPPRKPGQWEIRMRTEQPGGVPELTSRVCIDPSTDREIMEFGLKMSEKACPKYAMKREGKGFVIETECGAGRMKSVTRTTLTGDFQSSYTVRIEGTVEGVGGKRGPQPTVMVQTARWTGACKGMKPGDVTTPGGMKVNIKQLEKLKAILPKLQIR